MKGSSPDHFGTECVTRQPFVGELLALVCAASLLGGSARAPAAERQKLHGSVPAIAGHLPALERLAGTNRLNLVIVLPLRNREALASLLGQLYDPASPAYHQYLTPGQFAERFGPTRQDYEAVMAFAKANGLRVTRTHPNRTLLDVSGAVADIEKTFHVNLHVYQHPTEAAKVLCAGCGAIARSGGAGIDSQRPGQLRGAASGEPGKLLVPQGPSPGVCRAALGGRVRAERVSDRQGFPRRLRPGGLAGRQRAGGGIAGVRWLLQR